MNYFVMLAFIMVGLVSVPILHAQDTSENQDPKQPFTQIGEPSCEFLWAQLDLVRSEMLTNSNARLVVEITGITDSPRDNIYWYEFLRSYLSRYIPSQERWTIRTLPLHERREIKFWLIPPDDSLPPAKEVKWSYSFPPKTKPFLFTNKENYSVEVGVCIYVNELAMLANAVKDNPGARINLVLIVKTEREFIRRKREAINELESYGVSAKKVTVFKKRSRKPNPYGIQPTSEYWLLP